MAHLSAGPEQVLAFRLNHQHLSTKLPADSLLLAAAACGVQNTPPGSAAVALNARVSSLSTDQIEQALTTEKSLLQAWSLRGAPYIFPAVDAPVFTLGLLPSGEESLLAFIPGIEAALRKIRIRATQVVDLMGMAIQEILDGRTLTKDDLGVELARWSLPHLTASQKAAWQSPSWYARGQTLGESVARFALPVLSLRGLCCHAGRREGKAYLARADQWLGSNITDADPVPARAELLRRYLHCFGPSKLWHFAEWAGISTDQAAQSWRLVETELVEIEDNGKRAWLLRQDQERYENPFPAKGVRFLPPHDPYLTLRDRERLVPDNSLQRRIWKYAGNPGVLLVEGDIVGLWRQRKKGKRLQITIERFKSLSRAIRSQIEDEGETLTQIKDCLEVQIDFIEEGGELR